MKLFQINYHEYVVYFMCICVVAIFHEKKETILHIYISMLRKYVKNKFIYISEKIIKLIFPYNISSYSFNFEEVINTFMYKMII